jgi:hypothetical protein
MVAPAADGQKLLVIGRRPNNLIGISKNLPFTTSTPACPAGRLLPSPEENNGVFPVYKREKPRANTGKTPLTEVNLFPSL